MKITKENLSEVIGKFNDEQSKMLKDFSNFDKDSTLSKIESAKKLGDEEYFSLLIDVCQVIVDTIPMEEEGGKPQPKPQPKPKKKVDISEFEEPTPSVDIDDIDKLPTPTPKPTPKPKAKAVEQPKAKPSVNINDLPKPKAKAVEKPKINIDDIDNLDNIDVDDIDDIEVGKVNIDDIDDLPIPTRKETRGRKRLAPRQPKFSIGQSVIFGGVMHIVTEIVSVSNESVTYKIDNEEQVIEESELKGVRGRKSIEGGSTKAKAKEKAKAKAKSVSVEDGDSIAKSFEKIGKEFLKLAQMFQDK